VISLVKNILSAEATPGFINNIIATTVVSTSLVGVETSKTVDVVTIAPDINL